MRAFDTETLNRPGGGQAVLLTDSEGGFAEPKSFEDCFRFLSRDPKRISDWCAYNMDFDALAAFHENLGVNYRTLEKLAVFGRASQGRYFFEYIPSKLFRVKAGRRGFVLYDLAQFFGCPLRSAAEKYLPGEQGKEDFPKEWYSQIDRCLADARREKVISYALQDSRVLGGLFEKLSESFKGIGLEPKRWTSPAALSSLAFGPLTEGEPRIPWGWQEGFRKSYFGGRIEVRGLGCVKGPLNIYDINSAYPAEIARLQPLAGALPFWSGPGWRRNPLARYGSYHVEVDIPRSWVWGPLAVEDGPKIVYPVGEFRTWCGIAGLELLRRHGVKFHVLEAFEYIGPPAAPLFAPMVEKLYEARKNPVLKLAAKLVMNGWYGKLAEARKKSRVAVIGGRWHGFHRLASREVFGRYTCFPMAAAVTERVRCKVWEVLHREGKNAYMAMTDAVAIRGKLPVGKKLGEWGLKMRAEKGYIFGCGRYYLEGVGENGEKVDDFRFRGFSVDRGNLDSLRNSKGRTCIVKDLRGDRLCQWTKSGGQGELNVLRDVPLEFSLEDDKRYFEGGIPTLPEIFLKGVWSDSIPWEMFRKKSKREDFNYG